MRPKIVHATDCRHPQGSVIFRNPPIALTLIRGYCLPPRLTLSLPGTGGKNCLIHTVQPIYSKCHLVSVQCEQAGCRLARFADPRPIDTELDSFGASEKPSKLTA